MLGEEVLEEGVEEQRAPVQLEGAARGTIQINGMTPNMRPLLKRLRKLGHRVLLARTIMPSDQPPRWYQIAEEVNTAPPCISDQVRR